MTVIGKFVGYVKSIVKHLSTEKGKHDALDYIAAILSIIIVSLLLSAVYWGLVHYGS